METLWTIKSKVTKVYKEFETWFHIIFKFIIAFIIFGYINDSLGYMEALNNGGLRVLLSLVSAIVPSSIFVLLCGVISILHLYKLSLIMMILAFIVFIIFYFLYLKFAPEHGILMMAIPVLMPYNLHYIVPLVAGLFYNPFTIIPIGCFFIVQKFVHFIVQAAPMVDLEKLDVEAITAAYQFVIDNVLDNKEMLLYAGAFALIVVVTYLISRLPFDYSWYVAIGMGIITSIVGMAIFSNVFDVKAEGSVFVGSLLSGLIMCVVQFLHCTVDYAKKEYVQFEDDDYYYYVKALPKLGEAKVKKNKKKYEKQVISQEYVEETATYDESEPVYYEQETVEESEMTSTASIDYDGYDSMDSYDEVEFEDNSSDF